MRASGELRLFRWISVGSCGLGGNRTPIFRMQTGCSATKLRAHRNQPVSRLLYQILKCAAGEPTRPFLTRDYCGRGGIRTHDALSDITVFPAFFYLYKMFGRDKTWVKRRRKDSNLRCPFGHSSFQDCPFQPLRHASALITSFSY